VARILLADDNADSRFAVAQTLQKLTDHQVDEVDSGQATLERVRRSDYDLVVTRSAGNCAPTSERAGCRCCS
jgi:CheY-like chemotaxis protein